jgi:hypothetical protein
MKLRIEGEIEVEAKVHFKDNSLVNFFLNKFLLFLF